VEQHFAREQVLARYKAFFEEVLEAAPATAAGELRTDQVRRRARWGVRAGSG
jgi:hypothetical protein